MNDNMEKLNLARDTMEPHKVEVGRSLLSEAGSSSYDLKKKIGTIAYGASEMSVSFLKIKNQKSEMLFLNLKVI